MLKRAASKKTLIIAPYKYSSLLTYLYLRLSLSPVLLLVNKQFHYQFYRSMLHVSACNTVTVIIIIVINHVLSNSWKLTLLQQSASIWLCIV